MERNSIISELLCITCGQKMFIPRTGNQGRKAGHIKDMWCLACKEERKFIEVGNVSLEFLKEKIENNITLREEERNFLRSLQYHKSSLDKFIKDDTSVHKKR